MKRLKRFIKACPLAFCILCSWAVLMVAGHLPLTEKQIDADTQEEGWLDSGTEDLVSDDVLGGVIAANRAPALSEQALMSNGGNDSDADGEDAAVAGDADPSGADADSAADGVSGADDPAGADGAAEANGAGSADASGISDKPQKIKPEYLSYDKKKTDSPWYTDPGKIPLTTEYDYQKVKKDYFNDAVFIGDSRIVGMNDYSGLTNAAFFAKTGLTVYNLLDDKFVKDPDSGKTVSVSYMMQHYSYGKIYLMVGINELGTGGTERFADAYKDVLKKFRKWQPDAVIYVQSIMGVSPKKDKTDPVFNNTNIRDKNYAISKLTDGIHIFYLNIQELYEDKNHNLKQELTFDDVHIYAQHYDQWVKYLKTHAVVRGE